MTSTNDRAVGWVAMVVLGVRRRRAGVPPRLVMAEPDGGRTLSIPLPPDQAHLLAHALRGDPTPYSATCVLVEELLDWLEARVTTKWLTVDEEGGHLAEIGVEARVGSRVVRAGVGDAALLSRRLGLAVSVPTMVVATSGDLASDPAVIRDFSTFLDRVLPDEFAR